MLISAYPYVAFWQYHPSSKQHWAESWPCDNDTTSNDQREPDQLVMIKLWFYGTKFCITNYTINHQNTLKWKQKTAY